jgi:hypothetical protein
MGGKGANRRMRAGVWIAGLTVIAAIAATYLLTRPPELVWWSSPEVDRSRCHVRALIPFGWEPLSPFGPVKATNGNWQAVYNFGLLRDRRPALLRWISRPHRQASLISIVVTQFQNDKTGYSDYVTGIRRFDQPGRRIADRYVSFREQWIRASIQYETMTDPQAFDETHKAVCNSLRIE